MISHTHQQFPSAYITITASISFVLSTFYQNIQCTSRENKTLDLLYANIRDTYSPSALPPLEISFTNNRHAQQLPVTTRTVRERSHETMKSLSGALEATDWDVLYEPHCEDMAWLDRLYQRLDQPLHRKLIPHQRVSLLPQQ